MKTRLWCLVALLLLAAPVRAQNPIMDSGSITAVSSGGACSAAPAGCAVFTLPNGVLPSLTLQVSGTYSATLLFEATSDGTNWKTITGISLADGSSATGTTTTGQFSFQNSGLTGIRVRCTAYTSGTAVVTAVRGYATAKWLTPFFSTVSTGDGTKALPAWTFSAEPSSGWYRAGAGDVRLSVLNADRISVGTASTALNAPDGGGYLQVSNGTVGVNSATFRLLNGGSGNPLISTTAVSAPSACGTSPAVTTANGSAVFVVTGGTGGTATGCTITMPSATTGWTCSVNNLTGSAAHRADKTTVQTASTTTSVTWEYQTVSTGAAVAFTASDVFRGICFAY